MTSRELVNETLNHRQADRVPIDLGGTVLTGMNVSTVYKLRQALQLDPPGTPVKVIDVFQMLGEIKPDLLAAVGGDVVNVSLPYTLFGYKNEDWKPWTTFDGTPVLVPGGFNTAPSPDGCLLQYPQGDKSVPPSGKMPKGGFYCDAIVRQDPIDDDHLNPADNLEEFQPVSETDLAWLKAQMEKTYRETDKAIVMNLPGMAFGDIAFVPAPQLKHPKGIRDLEEWYMSTVVRKDYIHAVFEGQCEIALKNLERLFAAVGNLPSAVVVSGTDFGAQNGPFVSPRAFKTLYQPYLRRLNDWIHEHTTWKTFIHSCGSIMPLIPHMIDAGFDILNPVQTSAANMDPCELKAKFGDKLTFWGGGVDTQHTLQSATPDEIRREVKDVLNAFAPNGGYMFAAIHNVQQGVPPENLIALFETARAHTF
ncbi:MAG: methyltransferase [Kiritimatiellae bacterium]|nr:methyltransferase [Kiritimatiellia bacterium]